MNADEFLALVERHPLPWALEEERWIRADARPPARPPAECENIGLGNAAPAMAAAIINFVRANERWVEIEAKMPESEPRPELLDRASLAAYAELNRAHDTLLASLPASLMTGTLRTALASQRP